MDKRQVATKAEINAFLSKLPTPRARGGEYSVLVCCVKAISLDAVLRNSKYPIAYHHTVHNGLSSLNHKPVIIDGDDDSDNLSIIEALVADPAYFLMDNHGRRIVTEE